MVIVDLSLAIARGTAELPPLAALASVRLADPGAEHPRQLDAVRPEIDVVARVRAKLVPRTVLVAHGARFAGDVRVAQPTFVIPAANEKVFFPSLAIRSCNFYGNERGRKIIGILEDISNDGVVFQRKNDLNFCVIGWRSAKERILGFEFGILEDISNDNIVFQYKEILIFLNNWKVIRWRGFLVSSLEYWKIYRMTVLFFIVEKRNLNLNGGEDS